MSQIEIKKIGLTSLEADAIVNVANNRLYNNTANPICANIFRDAGIEDLTRACNEIGYCQTGDAVITPGFNLPAKYIIHTVGPIWYGGNNNEPQLLYSCYSKSLQIAKENNVHSIGFPLISGETYGYPKDQAWKKGIEACYDFISNHPDYEIDITFASVDDWEKNLGKQALKEMNINNKLFQNNVSKEEVKEEGVTFFWKPDEENGFLSQYYPSKFRIEGIEYQNAEQYMQAKKALMFGDLYNYRKIMNETDPEQCQFRGKEVTPFNQVIWNKYREEIIYLANLAKFENNEELKDMLLNTKDSIIVVANPYDSVYGVKLDLNSPAIRDPSKWQGRNLLGKILMKIRKELRDLD